MNSISMNCICIFPFKGT
uniref:Uncharacterized protein n=1 Tax=Anguilla anguilla TaxID=7936 RepID=A0A0E9VDB3_ANGAN